MRQHQVLTLYRELGSYKAIAHYLGLSPQTVHNHFHEAFRKLGVNGAIEAYRVLGWLK